MEVLITGNISFVTPEFLEVAFPEDHIVIAGETEYYLKKNKRITFYPIPVLDERFTALFNSHNFEKVIYISEYLELHGKPFGELEKLKALFRAAQTMLLPQDKTIPKIVYITSIDVTADLQVSKVVVLRACEELCAYYKAKKRIPVKIVRAPYLLQADNMESYINRLFRQMNQDNCVTFYEVKEQRCEFLAMRDLGEFLYRLLDNWDIEAEVVNLPLGFSVTFGDMGEVFKKIKPGIQVIYEGRVKYYEREIISQVARKTYGWFAKDNIIDELPKLYEHYLSHVTKELTWWQKLKLFYKKHRFILCGLELVLGFFAVEWINRLMGTSVQFSLVDVRLIFIVIMATAYGVNAGLAAAVLEGASIVLSYWTEGMDWKVLFYEPANWLVFIWYMVIGAVCGYIRNKKNNEINFLQREQTLLEEKYQFINQTYEDTLRNKSQYRKQIIGFRNSFGKIFQVTKRLDNIMPDKIFDEALSVLEELLENKSIAIFSVCGGGKFARLDVASRLINQYIPKTVILSEYAYAMDKLKAGEVWKNADMQEGYPIYLAGIIRDEQLMAIIAVYEAEYDQMGMYYANLIQILGGLIQISLCRAVEYNEAQHHLVYEDDMAVMRAEYFEQTWTEKAEMKAKGIATCELFKIQQGAQLMAEQIIAIEKAIRDTDIIGRRTDGDLYLLLNQVDDQGIAIVAKRLENIGISLEKQ
ncbi:MAG: hypothetical protein PHS82_11355 [Lachnospiraceae bacterium]|nr:hypothetical protein [Lachnospiraceae bacterium]